ncbi:MAG: hypothetical protein Q7V57_11070 [Actinomycetota bacterium]|nr:hypothetical protein [Actinomycetota bacterium]
MNLGDFFVRPVAPPQGEPARSSAGALAVHCMVCETDIVPFTPMAYQAGTTLAVLVLDAKAHVRTAHPTARWVP